ncbi:PEP-CTERM sorting domain-containing protein [Massilia sp. CF038]|uniref:PEP-CTERM sorting domain-containing protein n=1 Tax=Massilia sp. CF038 TaxID=1881045 RepID=UPI000919D1E5|nr:PEP-CTERM sorting domain-containing protein [Massilia sp. CF038]SHG66309.1 PEP-CTERM protein-sorting domain-containing protein [Massilia sp. CF038]
MKLSTLVRSAALAAALLASSAVRADAIDLPAANEMSTGTYNSFTVYSLDLLKSCAAALDPRCLPSNGLPVHSGPGQIADQAVVLQTADGQTNFPDPFPAGSQVDERMLTPTGNQSSTYTMGGFEPEPGGLFTGDQANRWEIKLSLLQSYLDGHDLVFMFDNNQAQSRTAAFIFLWGQARIVDVNGNTVGGCWELSTGNAGCADTGANPTPANAKYVAGATNFCVDKGTGVAYNIGGAGNDNDCKVSAGHPTGGYYVDNNTSTGVAEFAAFNQALHDAATKVENGEWFLQLNIKYYSNNGGAEQLWICSDCTIDRERQVPEPGSLPLIALGMLIGTISVLRARRRR